jgi:hypothetical protein
LHDEDNVAEELIGIWTAGGITMLILLIVMDVLITHRWVCP